MTKIHLPLLAFALLLTLLPLSACKTTSSYSRLTYNQYVGETIAGHTLAHGWRKDTINGGYNKEVYDNPYLDGGISQSHFRKRPDPTLSQLVYYYYRNGLLYSGEITDTIVSHTGSSRVFRANCINGLLEGLATVTHLKINYTISQANFDKGEMVGDCIDWYYNKCIQRITRYQKGSIESSVHWVFDENGKVLEHP